MKGFEAQMAELDKNYDAAVAANNEAVIRASSLASTLQKEPEKHKKAEEEHLLFKASSEDRIKFLEARHQ